MSTIERTLGAKHACTAVGYDRDRLNEYIAAGVYDCAPNTVPGRSRVFTVTDTVALYHFARFIERGDDPRRAGREACLLLAGMKEHPEAEMLYIVEPHLGSPCVFTAEADVVRDPANHSLSGLSIREVRGHNVGHIRRNMMHSFDMAFATKGDDE